MAIFGSIEVVKKQVDNQKFYKAFEYLEKVLNDNSQENERLNNLPLGAFDKVDLDNNNFALEQTYMTKTREDCFFESHKKFIDVQFILRGQETIEVANIQNLQIDMAYNADIDLVKYHDYAEASLISLKAGDIAIFFPEDGHMPCLVLGESCYLVKTVVKVPVD